MNIGLFFKNLARKIRKVGANRGYTCDVCGKELFAYPHKRLCADCENALSKNDGKTCDKCGRKTFTDGVCLSCKTRLPKFTVGISPLAYEGETAGLVNRLKNGDRRLAWYVAERMVETLKHRYSALENYQNGGEKLLLLPVPMTEEKQRKRGYNQTQDIAEALQTTLEKAGFACELDDETLIKSKDVAEQKHLDFVSRAENVGSAYHLHKRKGVQNRVILLIDDIMTTGATGSACAEKLLNAGAREVILLTVASAPEKK